MTVLSSPRVRATGRFAAVVAATGAAGAIIGTVARSLAGNRMAPWIVGRASGICAYLLLVALVLAGLTLSGSRRPWRVLGRVSRLRLHLALAAAAAAATVLHVVTLATDRYAGVGWRGTYVPMASTYRPVAVSLGLIGVWIGVVVGLTGLLAGHLPGRMWWPVHRIAVFALIAVWGHGVFGGGDTAALRPLYLISGALVLAVGWWRYARRDVEP